MRATLRAFPTPLRRYIGGPFTAPPAQQKRRGFSLVPCFGIALARTTRARKAASIAARLRRTSPQGGPHDGGQFDASPWMDCQRTPQLPRVPGAQGLCARRECGVAFSLLRAPALRPAGQLRCSRRSCGVVVPFSWPRKRKTLARLTRVKKGRDAARRRRVL